MTRVKVPKCVLGRPIAKSLIPIKSPTTFDVGYGPGQLKPDGSRQPETERRVLGGLFMLANGMSG